MTKILIIEDRKYVLENIIKILRRKDYDVKGAHNGKIGIKIAKKYLPDLIICDILMPELDGYMVLTEVRKNPAIQLTPFIFLTALREKDYMRKGMNLGADDYITKPFKREELLAAVKARLNKQKAVSSKIYNLPHNIVHSLPHEINTPLNGIIGFSDLIVHYHKTMSHEEICEMAQFINSSGRKLHRVTENFLLYAQIEVMSADSKKLSDLRKNNLNNPKKIITEASQLKAIEAKREKDLTLKLSNKNIQISKDDLKKIIEELTHNAFKFSKVGTIVRITSTISDDGFYTIKIIDNGKGMTQEQIDNIGVYRKFNKTFYETQKLGLGLIISKRLVELYNGKLTIKSLLNKETTVEVKLNILKNEQLCLS